MGKKRNTLEITIYHNSCGVYVEILLLFCFLVFLNEPKSSMKSISELVNLPSEGKNSPAALVPLTLLEGLFP